MRKIKIEMFIFVKSNTYLKERKIIEETLKHTKKQKPFNDKYSYYKISYLEHSRRHNN